MRTFEEWMAYQAIDLATVRHGDVKAWRSRYNGLCETQHLHKKWTPGVRSNTQDSLYAAAIRDASDLWLALWVRRNAKADYFVICPRLDAAGWDPHSSYHRDGRLHHKSHDRKMMSVKRQAPASGFKGTEQLLSTKLNLNSIRAVKAFSEADRFTGVLEIPEETIRHGAYMIAVDLAETNGLALAKPWSQIVAQRRFSENVPEVLFTVWRSEPRSKV